MKLVASLILAYFIIVVLLTIFYTVTGSSAWEDVMDDVEREEDPDDF